jgi:hypothetical protein
MREAAARQARTSAGYGAVERACGRSHNNATAVNLCGMDGFLRIVSLALEELGIISRVQSTEFIRDPLAKRGDVLS